MENEEHLERAIARLNARAWGLGMGLLFGVALFVGTNILVIRGGENVGQHLELLHIYFPGFRVTFLGSLVGFIYAFVLGYAVGRLLGLIYNRLVQR